MKEEPAQQQELFASPPSASSSAGEFVPSSALKVDDLEPDECVVEATVESVKYSDAESGFSVLGICAVDLSCEVAVGAFFNVQIGERLRMRGRKQKHARFGEQFRVHSYVTLLPSTEVGIERYLSSGMLKGVGKVTAKRLVAHFGVDTLRILDEEPERLAEVHGIGRHRRQQICKGWEKNRSLAEIMVFLQSHGISLALAVRIHKCYGRKAAEILRSDPFRLARDVSGVGFKTADRIAMDLGMAAQAMERVEAGVLYSLEQSSENGHMFVAQSRLVVQCSELLAIDGEIVAAAIEKLIDEQRLVREEEGERPIYLLHLWEAELASCQLLQQMLGEAVEPFLLDVNSEIDGYQQKMKLQLDPLQREAIQRALTERVLVITGGPGTGKTAIIRAIVELARVGNLQVELSAPTGRAAKRLQEATGEEARTLHRLLEFSPRDRMFLRDMDHPIHCDLLIVDEVSMVDAVLFKHLLEALKPQARIILVGDVDQLPSVGPGEVLADLLRSETIPRAQLKRNFRQEEQSWIVRAAHDIHQGQLPRLASADQEDADFFFVARTDAEEALKVVVEMVARRIPKKFGVDALKDIQVLVPMRKGELGVENLNQQLQQALNPQGQSLPKKKLRVGDRVIQLKNNYDLDVYNGDLGTIQAYDAQEEQVTLILGDQELSGGLELLDDLSLAYAITIHKSQGSEFPVVVLALHTQHHVMLDRNLIYTAVTRGRQLVVVVGHPQAMEQGIRRVRTGLRNTRLATLLG